MKSVNASASDWQGIEETQVRLISASSTLGDGKNLIFGLHFKMQEDWKVYWRSPGDAGFPPDLQWQNPQNRVSSEILWPRPERFEVLGLETLGYKNEVVYPLVVNVDQPQQTLNAHASLRFLTCSEICVPVSVDLKMDLESGTAQFSDEARLINKFKSQVPLQGNANGVIWQDAQVFKDANGKDGILRIALETQWPLEEPDAITEGPVEFVFQKAVITEKAGTNQYWVEVPFDGFQFYKNPLSGSPFTLTLMDQTRSVEIMGPIGVSDGPAPDRLFVESSPSDQPISLVQILIFAVIGGFILNAMPCVLPVLSIKLLGVIEQGGGETASIRKAFLASTAGILFSFLVLAGFLIALKSSGAAIGWGIQFQEPIFLIALALIIVLFACNLWGLYEITLPGGGAALTAVEEAQKSPVAKHFMSGAFATLLATPCSAPFLGTAVGFALSRGPVEILMVFLALGVGLALPYLLLAIKPTWICTLPKPGPWVAKVRFFMGFALLLTAIWLLSVLVSQIGIQATFVMAALFSAIIAVMAFRKKIGRVALPLVLGMGVFSFFVPHTIANPATALVAEDQKFWKPFEPAEIPDLVSKGQVVFVDVTADWCITCQVNKKVVLDQTSIAAKLQNEQVVAIRADWTSPDREIADYLAGHGKYGIPFNVVYGPGAPDGIVLPEILTRDLVQEAFKQAGYQ